MDPESMHSTDVLIFVEDPGAANFVAEIPVALAERGVPTQLVTAGSATDYLQHRGISSEVVAFSSTAAEVLGQSYPRVLLVGTSENRDSLGLALVARARSIGIESIGVVDSVANVAYRFRGWSDSALAFAPDWMLVPDQRTSDAYVALGYPDRRVVICGHPHYDYVRTVEQQQSMRGRAVVRTAVLPRAPSDGVVMVFAAEVSDGLNPEQFHRSVEYTLEGRGVSNRRTDIVLEEFLDSLHTIRPRPYLVLRLHPKNTLDEYTDYLHEFDYVSTGGDHLELIYAADLVVGMTSMLLMEAVLMGRPTISIVPRRIEKDWLPSIGSGATLCATTRSEVRSTIKSLVDVKSPISCDDRRNMVAWGSLERTTEFIEKLVQKRGKAKALPRSMYDRVGK